MSLPVPRCPRVLLVDDLEDQRELYRQYLSGAGFEVRTAGGGRAAVTFAVRFPPDVIVMDLAMPEMDGFEATRRLKSLETTAAIPVIALTAHGDMPQKRALQAGCSGFLRKPCYPDQLADEIRGAMSGSPSGERAEDTPPLVLVAVPADEDRNRYARHLACHGCRVVAARTLEEAVYSAPRLRPDVIVLDVDAPGGPETAGRLESSASTAGIPIVAVTARTRGGRRRARPAGPGFVDRSAEPDALLAEVLRVTGPSRS